MKKVIAIVLILLMILPCTVFAAEAIDVDKECSLTISYIDGNIPVAGSKCSLYYVASTDETGEVTKCGDFAQYDFLFIHGRDDKAWNELALTLKGYALRDKIQPVASATTGEDGKVTINGLKTGLYLVVPSVTVVGDYEYAGQPIMTFLPGTDSEKNIRDYDITINLKFDKIPYEPQHVKISAVKIWKDEGFENKRPKDVTVELLRDGEVYDTAKLNKENNWKYTWEELDESCEWLVVEKPVDNYKITIDRDKDTYYVTNETTNTNPPGDNTHKLPQTGQLWWPVPALIAVGLLFLIIGFLKRRREYDEE